MSENINSIFFIWFDLYRSNAHNHEAYLYTEPYLSKYYPHSIMALQAFCRVSKSLDPTVYYYPKEIALLNINAILRRDVSIFIKLFMWESLHFQAPHYDIYESTELDLLSPDFES